MGKKKKKKASKGKPEKPFVSSMTINGEAIRLQIQEFAKEYQRRIGRLTDD